MNNCIILYPSKTFKVLSLEHEKLSEILGEITFVGAISEENVFAIGSLNVSTDSPLNEFCSSDEYFEKDVRGTVVLIGSDNNGNSCDICVENVLLLLKNSLLSVNQKGV